MANWVQKTDAPYSTTYNGVREQLLYNDKLYIVGGKSGSGVILDKITAYDTILDSYDTTLSNMLGSRYYCAGAISGSTIFVFGGYNGGALTTCEKYDILTDTWSSIHDMPAGKWATSAARLENYIYVFGGVGNSAIYKYDIAGNTWTTQVQTNDDDLNSAVTVGNYIYLFGGHNNLNGVKKYDPINDVWASLSTSIPGAGLEAGNVFVHGTYAYLLGGSKASTQFLQYNASSNNWASLVGLPYGKIGGAGGITESSDIYIMGGGGGDHELSNLEYTIPPTTNPGGDINPYKSRIQG